MRWLILNLVVDITRHLQFDWERFMANLERGDQSKPRMKSSLQSSIQQIPTSTMNKYRKYYQDILTLGGSQQLKKTFLQERELAQDLKEGERKIFLQVVNQLERELLPQQ